VLDCPPQAFAFEHREALGRVGLADQAAGPQVGPACQHVVELEPREVVREFQGTVDGREERQWVGKMRCVLEEHGTLAQRFAHQAELRAVGMLDGLLQVPDATVDQLGAAAAGALSEVEALHQCDRESAAGGVKSSAGTCCPAPDDQDVEVFAGQPAQLPCATLSCALCHHLSPSVAIRASAVGSSMTNVLRKRPRKAPLTPSSFFSPATRHTECWCPASDARSGPL